MYIEPKKTKTKYQLYLKSLASDKYLGTLKVVSQVHKHLKDIWENVELLD